MRDDLFIYDADAHVLFNAAEYADLPTHLAHRRPREVEILDKEGLGGFTKTWVVDGKLHAYPFGAWAQPAQTPSGIREFWMRIIPGVRNALKTFHRGQAPEKRAKRMPEALKRFEMFPATSMRIMWNGTPSAPGRRSVVRR